MSAHRTQPRFWTERDAPYGAAVLDPAKLQWRVVGTTVRPLGLFSAIPVPAGTGLEPVLSRGVCRDHWAVARDLSCTDTASGVMY